MSSWPSLVLVSLAGLSVAFSAAYWRQPAQLTAPLPVYPVQPDAAALRALEQAIALLAPPRVAWLRTAIWQQVHVDPLCFHADGLYLAGPDGRLRLDLQVQSGETQRRSQTVSDGRTLWQAEQDGPEWRVLRVDVKRLRQTLDDPQTAPQARAEFFRRQLFSGPRRLLQSLRQEVVFTRRDRISWPDRDVVLLSGVRQGSNADTWPDYHARQCRLVLDAATSWPHRIEWWGPAPKQTGDVLLVELEFRQPVLGKPLPDRLFEFAPALAETATDHTAEWTEQIRTRSLALSATVSKK